MMRKSEVLFVDPTVDDLEHVLGATRPEVEAVLLEQQGAGRAPDRRRPGRQAWPSRRAHHGPRLARAHELRRRRLDGRDVTDDSGELSAIGRALAEDGDLRLWSCDTAYGRAGAVFLDALADAACADVAAAADRIGASERGGAWRLNARATGPAPLPPLTLAGIEAYQGVLPTFSGGNSNVELVARSDFLGRQRTEHDRPWQPYFCKWHTGHSRGRRPRLLHLYAADLEPGDWHRHQYLDNLRHQWSY